MNTMLSEKSRNFTIFGSFFVVFLVNHLVSGNSCEDTGFHPEKKGKYLKHHVIDAMTTETASLCRIMCYLQESCKSYNYQPSNGSCELSDSDETEHDLVNSPGHIYVKRKNPCEKNPCSDNEVCKPNYKEESWSCSCRPGHEGPNCSKVFVNCSELFSAGNTKDGIYRIDPDGQGSFQVYCDMTTDGGGWTVFQRNRNDSLTSFKRQWQEYKTGFGNMTGEFWLGLDKIYRLTKTQVASLRIDLEDWVGTKKHAVYSSFSIADESDFYRLNVNGYSGTAGDSITTAEENSGWINNKSNFSTPDKDNDDRTDGNCAEIGGWWYRWCSISDLNGQITWWTFSKTLNNTEMKLK
ncbi:fibrinogen-like protein 1 [Actinia tenebrosa]|uniref:Fibrinogen-like protein 1 n=1 Tax=Actinia tenebrosa TaxID=6105 RepID=A0A6P8IV38_ACTTE|nr:fibrinogen-like protein 1 [Actinia tenebrosa]